MKIAIEVLVDFLVTGSLYTLIAIGLSLVFSVMRIINFAHAQMYMLGAYGIYIFYGQLHWPFWIALVAAALIVGLFALFVERIIIRPVRDDAPRAMVATLGLLLVLGGIALIVFGHNGRFVPSPINGTIDVLGSGVDVLKLADAGVSVVIFVLVFAALAFTKTGRALRALSQDDLGARLQGVRVGFSRGVGFAFGSALAAVAGCLILPITSATPDMGDSVLLKMFIVLILGGLGSVAGAALGAFILALVETAGVTYFGQFSVLGVYLLVIAILLVRPTGILGRE